jgi:hypothetical protein
VSYSPMEYSPGLYCTVVSFLYLLLFFCAACISSFGWASIQYCQRILAITRVWLFMWFVCITCVPVYSTVQPQSGTILFFSHFYIWSNWIDKVRERDNLTCCVFTPHSAIVLD